MVRSHLTVIYVIACATIVNWSGAGQAQADPAPSFDTFGSVPQALYTVIGNASSSDAIRFTADIVIGDIPCSSGNARASQYQTVSFLRSLLQCRLSAPYIQADITLPAGSVVDVGGGKDVIGAKISAALTYRGFAIGKNSDIDFIGGKVAFTTSKATSLPDGLMLPAGTFVNFGTLVHLPGFALPSARVFGPFPLASGTFVTVDVSSGTLELRTFTAKQDFSLPDLAIKRDDTAVVFGPLRYRVFLGSAARNGTGDQLLGLSVGPGDRLNRFQNTWVIRVGSDKRVRGIDLKAGDAFAVDQTTRKITLTLRRNTLVGASAQPAGTVLDIDSAGSATARSELDPTGASSSRERVGAVAPAFRALADAEDSIVAALTSNAVAFESAATSQCSSDLTTIASKLRELIPKGQRVAAVFRKIVSACNDIIAKNPASEDLEDFALAARRDVEAIQVEQDSMIRQLHAMAPVGNWCRKYPVPILVSTNFGPYHMITTGQFQKSGHLVLRTEINEHTIAHGDCGRPYGYLYDKDGNELLKVQGERSCVDGQWCCGGPSVRTVDWSQDIPPAMVSKVAALVFFHMNDAPPPLDKLNAAIATVRQFAQDNPEVVQIVKAAAE